MIGKFRNIPLWLLILVFLMIGVFLLTIFGYPWKKVKEYCKENIYEKVIKETIKNNQYGIAHMGNLPKIREKNELKKILR